MNPCEIAETVSAFAVSGHEYHVRRNELDGGYDEAGRDRLFTAAVARGRGVSASRVESGYGQGRMLLAQPALAAGMADRIGTIEDAFRSAQRGGSRTTGYAARVPERRDFAEEQRQRAIRERAAQMAEMGI